MTKQVNVLFVAAEADPLVKVGGLGDVSGSLPAALNALPPEEISNHKIDARLVLPFHKLLRAKVENPKFLFSFDVPTTNQPQKAEVYQIEVSGLCTYLIAGEPINNAPTVYNTDAQLDGYKYVFFSQAIFPFIKALNWQPDILHANDWHTALAVYDLKQKQEQDPSLKEIRTILTVHNLPFMGAGTEAAFDAYEIEPSQYPRVPGWGRKFPLPLGLQKADRITTVSSTYAEEMMTPEFGCGLENLLKARKKVVSGIVNGLDMEAWDPSIDPKIKVNYNISTLSRRDENRKALIEEFDLNPDPTIPLLILISRMDPQKGVDIAVEGLRQIADQDWQAILLGTGNHELEQACLDLEKDYPNRVRAAIRYDGALSRRMYAGGDILLMPSRYEPCGLAQMMAMRYGCVPLARATGGLKDTIEDVTTSPDSGTGFLFGPADPKAFTEALSRALEFYKDQDKWRQIQKRGMVQDFSWKNSALNYVDLYLGLL